MEEKIIELDVSDLWTSCMNNTMAMIMNKYALQTIHDRDIRSIFNKAFDLAAENVRFIHKIFEKEAFPIPKGFTDEDVNLNAPRLYTDEFLLFYLHEMAIHGLTAYSLGLSTAHRKDVRKFYKKAHKSASELYETTLDTLQSKGLMERAPSIALPERIEFAEKQSFLAGWFGDHRPLNVIEISSLYFNLKKSIMAKALAISFSQTAASGEVRSFMLRTIELQEKHIALFQSTLNDDFISSALSWDPHITNSQTAPFSDKMMMNHAAFLLHAAMACYGTAFSSSMRRDLGAHYAASNVRLAKAAEDAMKIMIDNEWFEQPPHTVDRRELARI